MHAVGCDDPRPALKVFFFKKGNDETIANRSDVGRIAFVSVEVVTVKAKQLAGRTNSQEAEPSLQQSREMTILQSV